MYVGTRISFKRWPNIRSGNRKPIVKSGQNQDKVCVEMQRGKAMGNNWVKKNNITIHTFKLNINCF